MLSRAVLRIAERGGVDGRRPVDPRIAAEWRSNLEGARADVYESVGRALDASTAGAGDELTFTGETSEMWRDVHLATSVVSLFGSIMMPTDPFRIPYDFGDVSWYRGTSNLAVSSSTPGTGRQTLTSAELAAMIGWAYDLDEDAVIAVLPELRATLVRNAAEVLDDVVLNGDTSDDATNINADGATADSLAGSAGLDHYLVFDGLIHVYPWWTTPTREMTMAPPFRTTCSMRYGPSWASMAFVPPSAPSSWTSTPISGLCPSRTSAR